MIYGSYVFVVSYVHYQFSCAEIMHVSYSQIVSTYIYIYIYMTHP